jgi:hypothetical protein
MAIHLALMDLEVANDRCWNVSEAPEPKPNCSPQSHYYTLSKQYGLHAAPDTGHGNRKMRKSEGSARASRGRN